MKQITQEQINALIKLMEDLNVPVQTYFGVVKMLKDLPEIKNEDEDTTK